MITAREKLQAAFDIITKKYNNVVKEINFETERPVLKINLYSEIMIYIRYNDYGEYTYLVIFSSTSNDMMRFDKYDDPWDVSTRPHHFHTRGLITVLPSSMTGNPTSDITTLFKEIENNIS